MLAVYSYSIALPGCVFFAVRNHGGRLSRDGQSWLASGEGLARLTSWLQGAVMAIVLVGGSMLVLGPLPRRSRELLDDLAGRYQGIRDFL